MTATMTTATGTMTMTMTMMTTSATRSATTSATTTTKKWRSLLDGTVPMMTESSIHIRVRVLSTVEPALYRLYLGTADGVSIARVWGVPVLKMTASARRSF